jgi:hypothetical protein
MNSMILLVILACVALNGCAFTRSDNADLTGTAAFACGFDDGPATLVHLQAKGAPATWILNVQGLSPDRLDGTYPIDNSGRHGTANVRVCESAVDCTKAVDGTVVVTGTHRDWIDGTLAYRLPGQDTERHSFTAKVEATTATCP